MVGEKKAREETEIQNSEKGSVNNGTGFPQEVPRIEFSRAPETGG